MEYTTYLDMMDRIYRRYYRQGYVAYAECYDLRDDLSSLLQSAQQELTQRGEYKELFELSCKMLLTWWETDKDDSAGESQFICSDVIDAWDVVYNANDQRMSHAQMFNWIVAHLDEAENYCADDYLYDYLAGHFTEPELTQRKYDLYQDRILAAETCMESYYDVYMSRRYRTYMLRLLGDMGRPIDEIREYADTIQSQQSLEILADIELRYGNTDRAIALYRELAAIEDQQGWTDENWHIRLKDLFLEQGDNENYRLELDKALELNVGNRELWSELKNLYTPDEWPAIRDDWFRRIKPNDIRAYAWFAAEDRYDLIIDGLEHTLDTYAMQDYELVLKRQFPDRCVAVLVTATRNMAKESNCRRHYHRIAYMLSWIRKYDNDIAAALANEFRQQYPRRTALRDELSGF